MNSTAVADERHGAPPGELMLLGWRATRCEDRVSDSRNQDWQDRGEGRG